MLRAVVVLSLLYASIVEVLNAQNLDADIGAGEGRRLAAVDSAYTELMRAEGSDNAVNYENSKVRDQSLFSSTWPRKGGDIYNSGNCKTCRPITADPLTGKQYFLRWKIPASAIQSGIRSIVIGLDQYQVSLFYQSNTNTQDAYQPSVPQQLNTAPQGNNALYVITNSGIVFKINRITGAVIWQFDSGGTVGVGGAAAVLSNQNNNIDPSWVGRGALAVGNSNGLTLLGTQGLRYDWLNFTSSFQGLGDSQVTCSGVAGGTRQDQSVILGTQPKPGATTHFLVQLSDNGKQKSGLANTATPFSSNSYNYFGWKFTVSGTNGGAGFSTTPTIGPDGMVYVGSDKMYALTGAGSLVWSFNDGGDALFSIVNTAAMYSEGRLLFGSLNKKFYCLDSKGGAKKWAYTAGGAWKSYAAASSSSVYAANLDGFLYSLASSTGSLLWKTKLTGATMTAPVSMAADTILYFSNMAISASSGTVLWTLSELEPTAGNLTYAATAVSKDGTVYMGTESGALYALGGAPVPDPDTKFMEDLSNAVLASFKDWSYTSSGNVISTLPSTINFFNTLDFSKMPDGVTYRKNICPHAADYNYFGEYDLYNTNSYWYSNECGRQITVTCLNGKITLLRLKYLHRSMECDNNQGSFGSNFYLRGLSVPSSIGGLSGLTQLDLWGTDLLSLPTELGDLPRLRQLQLGSSSSSDAGDFWYYTNSQPSDNIVWSIPTEIGKLTTLWQLSIGSPVELPTHIGQLAGLAELRIDRVGKTISGIPSELGNLMSLTKLTVTTSSNSWASSFNPLIRNKCLPASLVSRLSPSLTQGRGLGLLTTGDYNQGFSPFLPPACLTVPYPSPPPSAAPSSAGSSAPTATEAPTPRMRTYAGTGLFVSKHVDQECKFQAYGVQYPFVSSAGTALKLSTCLPSPPSSTAAAGTTYYTLSCKVGAKKYSIEESVFSSSSCSGAPLSKSVYKHDKVCRWDPTNGGFLKIHCGDDDFLPRSSKKVVLGRPSASMTCERESVPSDAAPNATYWLDLCSPRYVANMLRGPSIAYNFVLSVDTSPRGAAAVGAAGLRVIETRFDPSDVFCARGPLSQKAIFFPNGPASGSPACVKDPLSHGRYYQVSPGVNPQVIAAVQSSAPTPSPTRPYTGPVPTAPPTLNPATARPTSTLQPTSSIWTKSFASNFTSTGCTSSQYVTGLPFCTGSLGSFWTVGWQNVGSSNPVTAPSLPYPIYATTRTGSAQPYAVMLYGGLQLTSQPSALANVKGVVYSIEFDVAPAAGTAHSTPYHFTRSEDFVSVGVVRKSNGSPLNPAGAFKFYPSNFQDVKYNSMAGRQDNGNSTRVFNMPSQCSARLGCVWFRAAFQYVGDGTGPVSLRFSCGCDSAGSPEFCGALDNIAIVQLGVNAPSPLPTPAPSFQALRSPTAPPLYLVINNEWGANNGLSRFGGRELQFWNGNKRITGLKARCGAWASDESASTLSSRYGISSSSWPNYYPVWPGFLTDGDLSTPMQLDAKKNKILGVIYVDLTGVQFDRIVFFPLIYSYSYAEDTNVGGSRIALVNSPDSPPIWQSSFPANTLRSNGPTSFTFYPFSSQLNCNAGSCVGRLNSTSSAYCFGTVAGACPTSDCTTDLDCIKKYNLDVSTPKKKV